MKTEFEKSQFELAYPNGVEHNYWGLTRNYILWKNIKGRRLQNETILEIGCGRGGVVKYLQNRGINCHGVELADCTPHNGAEEFIQTDTDALNLEKDTRDKYTVIMLLDVIEHIENPEEFVKQVLEKFENVKALVITVPARQEIWSNYDEFYGHFVRYDLTGIKAFIESHTFQNNELRYFFHCLYPMAKLQLKISKNRKVQVAAPKGIVKLIHRLISYFFIIEYHLFPGSMKGTSILSVSFKK